MNKMTREKAKELLPIIRAWTEGKEIQIKSCSGKWIDIKKNEELNFMYSPSDYRIKPKPKYRPFKNREECWNEMLKHQPFGWIKAPNEELFFIYSVFDEGITYRHGSYRFKEYFIGNYTFTDGTPLGIKEE